MRLCLSLAISLLALLNLGCVAPQLTKQLLNGSLYDDTHRSIPNKHEIRATPFYSQKRYQCGPSSLATVLNYRGVDTSLQDLKTEIYLPKRKGSLQIEIASAVRSRQLLAYPISPSLEDLFKEIAANNPVMVLQNLGLSWIPVWHYSVVIGYNLEKQHVILRSGKHKRITTPFNVFENTWRRSQFWGVVIIPPDQLPSTAKELPLLKAANVFEVSGSTATAQEIYLAILSKWPDNQIALMGMGNTYYAQKEYSKATKLFKRLVLAYPKQASSWNNLAYSLSSNGCIDEAIIAAKCAILLSPSVPQYSESLVEIKSVKPTTSLTKGCQFSPTVESTASTTETSTTETSTPEALGSTIPALLQCPVQ